MNCGSSRSNQHAEKMCQWHMVTNEGVQKNGVWEELEQSFVTLWN